LGPRRLPGRVRVRPACRGWRRTPDQSTCRPARDRRRIPRSGPAQTSAECRCRRNDGAALLGT
jgi:hypothetical protein